MSMLIALGIVMTVASLIVADSLWSRRDLRRSWVFRDLWWNGVFILILLLAGAIASFVLAVVIGR